MYVNFSKIPNGLLREVNVLFRAYQLVGARAQGVVVAAFGPASELVPAFVPERSILDTQQKQQLDTFLSIRRVRSLALEELGRYSGTLESTF